MAGDGQIQMVGFKFGRSIPSRSVEKIARLQLGKAGDSLVSCWRAIKTRDQDIAVIESPGNVLTDRQWRAAILANSGRANASELAVSKENP